MTTCSDCKHMGRPYWEDLMGPIHFCDKSRERRAAAMKPTGDFAEDFMRNFRTFFDAAPHYNACSFFEPIVLMKKESSETTNATTGI